jgi:hypothetical protein
MSIFRMPSEGCEQSCIRIPLKEKKVIFDDITHQPPVNLLAASVVRASPTPRVSCGMWLAVIVRKAVERVTKWDEKGRA